MKRIAITGSNLSQRTVLSKAISDITGFDLIICSPYSTIAEKYGLVNEISKCQWPDSFVYCMGAFIQRAVIEQKFEDYYISDGSVFHEISWLKSRFPNIELIYERSMIESLERVITNYAIDQYDFIFHINSKNYLDVVDQCLKQTYFQHKIKYHIIDSINNEKALNQIMNLLQTR